MNELSVVIFDIFNSAHMALGCFALAILQLYLARTAADKKWPRILKAFNWTILGLAFATIFILGDSIAALAQRSWLRFAFALLIIGEISYYGDIFFNIAWRIKDRIR